ncbi:MAG: methyltransferase domain-containing protein [Gemmatimonadetes bacterium]|nr:methyltransferase domain-containing protein [Gemmatimonadota bacterium]
MEAPAFLQRFFNFARSRASGWLGSRSPQRAADSTLRVVVGAGGVFQPGWIATDIDTLDVRSESDWRRHFALRPIDAVLAEHVWEHLAPEEALEAARNCYRYLRPGGYVRAAVPDGLHPDAGYRDWVRPGGSGPGADDHQVLYTYRGLSDLFQAAGFRVELLEYFDENGHFHYRDWDPQDGMIRRSSRFDERNRDGRLNYTSIILDARKPHPVRPRVADARAADRSDRR